MSPRRPPYPGQLPVFRFKTLLKPIRQNIAEYRAVKRISMSNLRKRRLQEFDYEAYRAEFEKRYMPA